MELVVLRRLLVELSERLVGQRIDQAYALPPHHLAVVVGARGAPRLWFSAEPDEPHLYLRPGGHESPARPPAFAMAVRKWLRGQRITDLGLIAEDRVVELRASGPGARIVYELVPRRASAFLVPPDGTVAAVWNPRRGRPGPGHPYTPPERRARTPLDQVDDATWARFESAADERALVSDLLRSIAGMTGLVAREVAAQRDDGPTLRQLVTRELERAVDAPTEPRIYSPGEPDRLRALPAARELILAPYPLRQATGLHETICPDLTTAAAELYTTRARLRLVDGVRRAVAGGIRSRAARLQRARERIDRGASDPEDAARLRRLGDLLLAAPGAPLHGARATVPDVYGDGGAMQIPIDPSRSLVDNAQDYYRKARRAERRVEHDRSRLADLDAELERLERIGEAATSLTGADDSRRLLRAAESAGLEMSAAKIREPEAERRPESTATDSPHGPRSHPAQSPSPAGPPPAGVRRYRTRGGDEILVGRSAKGNDQLTHRLAAREDWWLHAEGPGSHVVLRNPERRRDPPEGALLVAAAVAAWFSKARDATKAEVRWTRVRDVKRPRGGAPGLALLERYQSLLVEPQSPQAMDLQEEA